MIAFGVVGILGLAALYGVWDIMGMYRDAKAVPCDEMPAVEVAQRVISEHQVTIRSLLALSTNGGIWVETGMNVCPGKADVLIFHRTESQKKKIKRILGEDFFGVPYRLANI